MRIGATREAVQTKETPLCPTLSSLLSASAGSPPWRAMLPSAPSCEAATMTDPILALAVAIGLGAYLIYTLLRPERF